MYLKVVAIFALDTIGSECHAPAGLRQNGRQRENGDGENGRKSVPRISAMGPVFECPKILGALSSHSCTAGGSQPNVSSLSREGGSKGARTEAGREGG